MFIQGSALYNTNNNLICMYDFKDHQNLRELSPTKLNKINLEQS